MPPTAGRDRSGGASPRVWWVYGPPCVEKSVTAWQLHTRLMEGEPRAYLDVDQVGLCFPDPADDPGRFALKCRAAGALVRWLVEASARTVVVSGVLQPGTLAAWLPMAPAGDH